MHLTDTTNKIKEEVRQDIPTLTMWGFTRDNEESIDARITRAFDKYDFPQRHRTDLRNELANEWVKFHSEIHEGCFLGKCDHNG